MPFYYTYNNGIKDVKGRCIKQKTHPGTLFLWCSVVCTVSGGVCGAHEATLGRPGGSLRTLAVPEV